MWITVTKVKDGDDEFVTYEDNPIPQQCFPGTSIVIADVHTNGCPTVDNNRVVHWRRRYKGKEQKKEKRWPDWVQYVFWIQEWTTYERDIWITEEWDAPKGNPDQKENYVKTVEPASPWEKVDRDLTFGFWVDESNVEEWSFQPPPISIGYESGPKPTTVSFPDEANGDGTQETQSYENSTANRIPEYEKIPGKQLSATQFGKVYSNNPDEFIASNVKQTFSLIKNQIIDESIVNSFAFGNTHKIDKLPPGYHYIVEDIRPISTVAVPKPIHTTDSQGFEITYADYLILLGVVKESNLED